MRSREVTCRFRNFVLVPDSAVEILNKIPDLLIRDKAAYLLHWLVLDRAISGEWNFKVLTSKHLEKAFGPRYRTILEPLEHSKVIVIDHHFRNDAFNPELNYCKQYAITPEHQVKWHKFQIASKSVLAQLNKPVNSDNWNENHHHLFKWLQDLSIDEQALEESIQLDNMDRERNGNIQENWKSRSVMVMAIRSGHLRPHTCKQGRWHNPLTCLYTEGRRFLNYKGVRLEGTDLANSQPLFLAWLACVLHNADDTLRDNLNYYLQNDYDTAKIPDSLIDETLKPFQRDTLPEDLVRFLELCEQGKFYECMQDELNRTRGNKPPYDREYTKDQVFKAFFSDWTKYTGWCPLIAIISRLFPSVWSIISQLKRYNYRHSSRFAQRIESHFVINHVIKDLRIKHRSLPIFLVHDSIYTTSGNLTTVEAIFREHFAALGIHPTFKQQ